MQIKFIWFTLVFLGAQFAHADFSLCARYLSFVPHQFSPSEIRGGEANEEDRPALEAIIHEAQPVFQQGVPMVVAPVHGRLYWIEQIILPGETIYTIKPDSDDPVYPSRVRVAEDVQDGAAFRTVGLKDKALRDYFVHVPMRAAQQRHAYRYLGRGNSAFIVYRDIEEGRQTTREIASVIGVRPYIISATTLAALPVSLQVLDAMFQQGGDRNLYRDVELDHRGLAREVGLPNDFRWFISLDQAARVVLKVNAGRRLPEVVSVESLTEPQLGALADYAATHR